MGEQEHTPGPWKIVDPPQASRRVMMPDDTVEIRAPQGGMVACLYAENFHNSDAANGRLIAAAPDMLAALKGILDPSDAEDYESLRPEWRAVADAIAKATGAAS